MIGNNNFNKYVIDNNNFNKYSIKNDDFDKKKESNNKLTLTSLDSTNRFFRQIRYVF